MIGFNCLERSWFCKQLLKEKDEDQRNVSVSKKYKRKIRKEILLQMTRKHNLTEKISLNRTEWRDRIHVADPI